MISVSQESRKKLRQTKHSLDTDDISATGKYREAETDKTFPAHAQRVTGSGQYIRRRQGVPGH